MPDQKEKKSKVRSPNFPAFSLERSLECAVKLYERFAKNSVAFEVATKALGYSAKSSVGKQVMATLSYYGLIESQGIGEARKIKVSDLAFKIIFDKRQNSSDRGRAIREAALRPRLFKEIAEKNRDKLPDDAALEYELINEHSFNTGTVKDFISVFKKTMDFAKVYESDIMPDEKTLEEETGMIVQDEKTGLKGNALPPIPPMGGEREKALYSLGGDLKVRIVFSGKSTISDKAIEKLMKLLEINKEDFIEEKVDSEEPN